MPRYFYEPPKKSKGAGVTPTKKIEAHLQKVMDRVNKAYEKDGQHRSSIFISRAMKERAFSRAPRHLPVSSTKKATSYSVMKRAERKDERMHLHTHPLSRVSRKPWQSIFLSNADLRNLFFAGNKRAEVVIIPDPNNPSRVAGYSFMTATTKGKIIAQKIREGYLTKEQICLDVAKWEKIMQRTKRSKFLSSSKYAGQKRILLKMYNDIFTHLIIHGAELKNARANVGKLSKREISVDKLLSDSERVKRARTKLVKLINKVGRVADELATQEMLDRTGYTNMTDRVYGRVLTPEEAILQTLFKQAPPEPEGFAKTGPTSFENQLSKLRKTFFGFGLNLRFVPNKKDGYTFKNGQFVKEK